MSFSINTAIIAGNAVREPELKFTPSGQAVCSLSVATSRSTKKNDKWEDISTFHNVVVWGKMAEYCANNIVKGSKVTVQGRIDNRSYNAKDGSKKYISEIVAETVIVAGQSSQKMANNPVSGDMPTVTVPSSQTEDSVTVDIPEGMPF